MKVIAVWEAQCAGAVEHTDPEFVTRWGHECLPPFCIASCVRKYSVMGR